MMNTADVRNLILNCKLAEQAVVVPGWEGANLVVRELSGKAGSELISMVTDAEGIINQEDMIAGIILATLRNVDDGGKLVFGYDDRDEANPNYRDSLMGTGLGRIMEVAKMSIKLSGLDEKTAVDGAKNASSATPDVNSLTTSQAA